MTKQLFSLVFSVGIAAFLTAACEAPALEDIQNPEGQETEVVPEWTTIPYSLSVSTEKTRVSYDESANTYSFNSGDKIRVTGTDRTDISGELEKNGDSWTGNLTYLTNQPLVSGSTGLKATLIHAGNPSPDEYGTALVGGVPAEYTGTLLQYVVENHSLFTATYTYNTSSTASVELQQQAAFLDVTFTFDFDGSHQVEPGQAWVDLEIDGKELSVPTQFYATDSRNEDFQVHFIAVVPGGKKTDEFILMVGDREIEFQKNSETNAYPTLVRNKKYTVNRTIVYGPQLGDPYWSDGTYGRLNHSDPNASIVGIVVYVNHHYTDTEKARIEDAITEKRTDSQNNQLYGHGLVMALKNVTVTEAGQLKRGFKWCSSSATSQQCTGGFITKPSQTMDSPYFSGLDNTNDIIAKAGYENDSAAALAKHYGAPVAADKSSGWFLPSIGQWMYTISIDGFGNAEHADEWINGNGKNWLKNGNVTGDLVYVKKCEDGSENVLVKALNERLSKLHSDFASYNFEYDSFGDPSGEANISDNYWTSTEKSESQAIRMNLGTVETWQGEYYSTIKAKGESKTIDHYTYNSNSYQMKVRPFLAF